MSRPWMPLYVGDYLRDTHHLSLKEHGAYMLIIMHYWTYGKVPETPTQKCRCLGIQLKQLPSIWSAIAPFFDENGRHKRLDAELEKHRIISEKRKLIGQKGGLISRRRTNDERFGEANGFQAIGKQTGGISQSHKESSSLRREPPAPRRGTSKVMSDEELREFYKKTPEAAE